MIYLSYYVSRLVLGARLEWWARQAWYCQMLRSHPHPSERSPSCWAGREAACSQTCAYLKGKPCKMVTHVEALHQRQVVLSVKMAGFTLISSCLHTLHFSQVHPPHLPLPSRPHRKLCKRLPGWCRCLLSSSWDLTSVSLYISPCSNLVVTQGLLAVSCPLF